MKLGLGLSLNKKALSAAAGGNQVLFATDFSDPLFTEFDVRSAGTNLGGSYSDIIITTPAGTPPFATTTVAQCGTPFRQLVKNFNLGSGGISTAWIQFYVCITANRLSYTGLSEIIDIYDNVNTVSQQIVNRQGSDTTNRIDTGGAFTTIALTGYTTNPTWVKVGVHYENSNAAFYVNDSLVANRPAQPTFDRLYVFDSWNDADTVKQIALLSVGTTGFVDIDV